MPMGVSQTTTKKCTAAATSIRCEKSLSAVLGVGALAPTLGARLPLGFSPCGNRFKPFFAASLAPEENRSQVLRKPLQRTAGIPAFNARYAASGSNAFAPAGAAGYPESR